MLIPTRRNKKFDFDKNKALSWHENGPATTAFFNSLSVLFPEGERFFIRSVRNYQNEIKQYPQLQEAVEAFISQETIHGREHDKFNDALDSFENSSFNKKIDAQAKFFLEGLSKHLTRKQQLAVTIAIEHFTAILA